MSAQTADQQVSKGLLITLAVVAAIGAAAALWVFVVQPLTANETADQSDAAAATEPDAGDPAGGADEPAAESDEDDSEDPESSDDADGADEPDAAPPEETVEVVTARDPFQPLVGEDAGRQGAVSTGTSNGSGGGADDDQTAVGSTTVTLVDIYTGTDGVERASVEVDQTGYDVAEGETFAEHFKLLDISGDCATMLHGDSRFTLCEGDRIRK